MAGFKTHITVSTIAGLGYGGAAYWFYHVPIPTCVLAGGLCAVSGMLPDIDSDSGRPLRESIAFAAAIIPMMLVDRFSKFGLATETMVLIGAFAYLIIRFGAASLLRKITVHRGMLHSLPAAIIFGEVAFLLASGDDIYLRYYKAGGVVAGYLSHLILDEIYSIEWHHGHLRLKKSFGTGIKVLGHKILPNLATYSLLALFTMLAVKEPGWMRDAYQVHQQRVEQYAKQRAGENSGGANDGTPKTEKEKLLEAFKAEFGDPTTLLR